MLNDRVMMTAFLISFAGHCLFLGVSGFNLRLPHPEKKPEEITVNIEIEKQALNHLGSGLALLPKINIMGEATPAGGQEKKFKEVGEKQFQPQEAILRYQDIIKQRIEEVRRYPVFAKRQGIEGVVHLSFTVLFNGLSKDVKIVRPSGSNILDEEAIETIKRAGPFPAIPKEINQDFILMEVVLIFNLEKT